MSWPLVRVTEVARVVGGATPKTDLNEYWGNDILWATPKDLSNLKQKMIAQTDRRVTLLGLKNCAAEVLPKGSVLFSSRAPIGHVAINDQPMATNQGFKSFIPNERLDASFLYWWLDANRVRLQAMGTGATFKEVSKATVEKIELPLPPLDEQKRIAAILDQADELRRLRARALEKLNSLGQAIFHEMFGDLEIEHVEGLGSLAEVSSGITKGRKLNGNQTRLISYMAVSNVQDQYLDLTSVKQIEATDGEIARYMLRSNDLLLTEGGDPDKLGRGSLWRNELPECIHQNHVFRVRPNTDLINPIYLQWFVASRVAKDYFLRCAKQTTGIASINKTQLSALPVLVPSMDRQSQFADKVAKLNALLEVYTDAKTSAENVFFSLQSAAFQCKL